MKFIEGLEKIASFRHGVGVAFTAAKNKGAQLGNHLHKYRKDYLMGGAAAGALGTAYGSNKKKK